MARTRPRPRRRAAEKPRWCGARCVLGVDPGLNCGIVVLERLSSGDGWRCAHGEVVITKKGSGKKGRANVRVSTDDVRRYHEVLDRVEAVYRKHTPSALGVETYVVKGAAGLGFKAGIVYGAILGWARAKGLFASVAHPQDIKRRFCESKDAWSKLALERSIRAEIQDISKWLDKTPKTHREHMADAAAHALIMVEELDEIIKAGAGI